MSKKIYGDINVSRNTIVNSKNVIRDINNITADSSGNIPFPVYTKEEIDRITAVLPVSRVGTMDYLPMSINGSFEGSSNYIGKGVYPVVIESDGTVVYLRPGTNGSTFGYYYCYISDARNVADLQPVLTNEKFKPSTFTSNHTLTRFISSNGAEVLMMATNNGTNDTYTMSLTNGTMNVVSHQSTEFLASAITGTNPQYACLVNDKVYIFCIDSYSNAGEVAISVYTISTADIIAGTSSSLVKVTGFTGQNLFGDNMIGSTNIKLAPMNFSNTASDQSLVCIPTGNVYRTYSAYWGNNEGSLHAEVSGNNIRIAFIHASEIFTQQNYSRVPIGISLVLNTSTKAYTIDNGSLGQITITTDSSGVITIDNPYYLNYQNYWGIAIDGTLNRVPTYTTTSDGVQFCAQARHDTNPQHFFCRMNISNFTSKYDAWNLATGRTVTGINYKTISPVFGSVIGENLIHPTIINANKIMMHCAGTLNGVLTDNNTSAYTSLSGSPNYVYNSISTGSTINGFAPNVDRGVLTATDNRYIGCVTIMNQDGSTKVYGSSFFEGQSKYSALEMNQTDFSFAQQITIGSTVLSTLKTSILSSVTLPYAVSQSFIALYYVPDNTYTKSFAITTVMVAAPTGTNNTYLIVSEVDCTLVSNVLTSATATSSVSVARGIAAVRVSNQLLARQGGMIIAKYADFTYVGIPAIFSTDTSSNANFGSVVCKVDNSTKIITGTPTMMATGYNSSSAGAYEVGVLPGIGFGLFENGTITDIKTKLVFKNFGTTASQFDTMVSNLAGTPISRIVVAAQDVPQGFNVYFTQQIPIFLKGLFYEMPVTTINLSDIDASPGNKTFYLYIVVVEGIPEYQISTTMLTEELYRVYIGTIITGTSSISSISTEKVTRFLTYRPSTTQRGSAIPASTGVPSSTGTRWG